MGRGHAVLLVPVPQLEPFIRARWEHYDPAWVSDDPAFAHAHVTLLSPFLAPPLSAGVRRTLLRALSGHHAFRFDLRRIATFPNGIVHALPEPDDGFRRLTADLVAGFPQCPPYAGEFPDPVPHLTLDLAHGEVTEASVACAVAACCPPSAAARTGCSLRGTSRAAAGCSRSGPSPTPSQPEGATGAQVAGTGAGSGGAGGAKRLPTSVATSEDATPSPNAPIAQRVPRRSRPSTWSRDSSPGPASARAASAAMRTRLYS